MNLEYMKVNIFEISYQKKTKNFHDIHVKTWISGENISRCTCNGSWKFSFVITGIN